MEDISEELELLENKTLINYNDFISTNDQLLYFKL